MWGTVPVTFIGKTPQQEIDQLYARMDVLVAPSVWPESYGLVTREAAAAGVWVIASSIGAIGEDLIEGDTGTVIEPKPAALLQVFKKLELSSVPFVAMPPVRSQRDVAKQVAELSEIYQDIFKRGE